MSNREEKIQILVNDYEQFLTEKTDKEIEQIFESNDFVIRRS